METLENFKGVILLFIITTVILAVGTSVMYGVQTQAGSNWSNAGGNAQFNVSERGVVGMSTITSYMPILGLVLIAALVITFLVSAFRE